MLNYTKKALFIGVLCSITSLNAYNYNFKNWIEKEIDFRFQLIAGINEPVETIHVPAAKKDASGNLVPGEASRNFEWLRAGLCMHTSNFSVRIVPSDDFRKPALIGWSVAGEDKGTYKMFKNAFTTKEFKLRCYSLTDSTPKTMEEFAKCQREATTCGSTIEIGATPEGYPLVWLSTGAGS